MSEPIAVRVPQVNVNDDQVRIEAWLVACGQRVEKGQPVAVVETSKAMVEVEAPEAGYVRYTHRPDDEVPVGGVLCTILPEPAGEAPPAPGPEAAVRGPAADGREPVT